MFPLNLDDDLMVHRVGGWQVEVVNLFKKVEAAAMIRPWWKPGDKIAEEKISIVTLDPEGSKVVELTNKGVWVIHWMINKPKFFDEVRMHHMPKDSVFAGPALLVTGETESYLRPAKAREFRLG